MRKVIIAAAAVAALLAIGAPENRALAMPVATPAALGLTSPDLSGVQQVSWGWHRRWAWHRHWGWRRPWAGPRSGYSGYRGYWGGPWWPEPYYGYGYYGRPLGAPCCWWGWHRRWRYW